MYYLMSQRSWGIAACAPAAFLFATSIAVTFTACSDDLMADNSQPVTNPESDETLFEAYGLTSFFCFRLFGMCERNGGFCRSDALRECKGCLVRQKEMPPIGV